MPLTVSVRKNTLIGRTKNYRFHTIHESTVGYDKLVSIMSEARTTLSKPDIVACITLLAETVSDLVSDGKFVKTPLGDFYLSAIGTIDDPGDSFSPSKERSGHGVRLRFRPDRSAEAKIAKALHVKRDDSRSLPAPYILALEPVVTKPDRRFEPGDIVRLSGYRLAFDRGDQAQGVFLANEATRAVYRCSVYAHVAPSLLILQLPPEIEPGDYALTVRTATATGSRREGRLGGSLAIGAPMKTEG